LERRKALRVQWRDWLEDLDANPIVDWIFWFGCIERERERERERLW
jgi:hypothetical protein